MLLLLAIERGLGPALLVLAVGAPVLLAVVARPQRGLLLLAALLPFDGLLLVVDVPEAVVAWKEVLLGVTLGAAVLFPTRLVGVTRRLPGWLVALGLLALLAIVTVPAMRSVQAAVGMKVAFFGALTGVVAYRCPLDAEERDRLVGIFAAVGVITSLVAIWQQAVGPERLNELGYAYNSVIRFTGPTMRSWSTFNQPFPFAFHLMVVILLCGAVALGDTSRLRNRLLLAAMPLYAVGLATSVVRGAWLATAVGLVHLAVTRHRSMLHLAPVAAAATVVAVVVGVTAFFASDSLTVRFDRWTKVPAVVSASPMGEGIGSAGAAAAKAASLDGGDVRYGDANREGVDRTVFQPDNHYAKVAFELGVLGLWLFALVLGSAYAVARVAASRPGEEAFGAGVAAVVVAAGFASLGATFFEIFPLDYLVWMLVGVVSVPIGAATPKRAEPVPAPAS